MSRLRSHLLTPLVSLLLTSAVFAQAAPKKRSLIFFIGDGMGSSQITLGRLGARAKGKTYAFDRFCSVGLSITRSTDCLVTDSAAAATAMATGVKTNNHSVGIDPDGRELETIVDAAHRLGYMTGVVTTTRVTHATPASFMAHAKHRRLEGIVARQLASRGTPEVLLGGGARHFNKKLRAQLVARGYALVTDPAALADAKARSVSTKGSDAGGDYDQPARPRLAGFLAKSHLPFAVDGGARVSLLDMVRKAVDVLASGGPFLLVVEGGRIDHAGHSHDAVALMGEQLELADAVGWALDRAVRDPRLLVVVTADHATAGMGIAERVDVDGLLAGRSSSELLTKTKLSPKDDVAVFQEAVDAAYAGFSLSQADARRIWSIRAKKDTYWPRTALGHLVSERFGVYFFPVEAQQELMQNAHGHDGAMVPVFAYGPGSASFAGTYQNTEIPRKIVAALRLTAGVDPGGALRPKAKRPRYFKK